MRGLLVVATAAALGCVAAPSAVAAGPYDFSSGAATVHHHFAWSAHDGPNGITGHMTAHFRNKNKIWANVTCLQVAPLGPNAHSASIVGVIYKSSDDFGQVGDMVEFEVVDRTSSGEGDTFRYRPNPFDPSPANCQFDEEGFPITQGNVVVEQAVP